MICRLSFSPSLPAWSVAAEDVRACFDAKVVVRGSSVGPVNAITWKKNSARLTLIPLLHCRDPGQPHNRKVMCLIDIPGSRQTGLARARVIGPLA